VVRTLYFTALSVIAPVLLGVFAENNILTDTINSGIVSFTATGPALLWAFQPSMASPGGEQGCRADLDRTHSAGLR
jgi:hypothetical protein